MSERFCRTSRWFAVFIAFAWVWVALPVRAGGPVILHATVEGVINPVKARYIKQALERARDDKADILLLSINTPGGLVSSMQDIIDEITRSTVPVVGLVEPKTGQATSAGAFILLATDVAGMLPDARVGAAHPVGAGEPLKGAVEQKATNSLASLAKSLAARRGRPESVAEGIVRESVSYTAAEAEKQKLVEMVVSSRADFLTALDGRRLEFKDRQATLSTKRASIVEFPLSWTNQLLDKIADPTIASILLTIGVLGILYELSAPGIGMGGIVGATSLVLGLLAMSVLPIRLAGFLLIVAGFIAIAVEVKVQTHGLLALGGIGALVLGALVLVDEARYFGPPQELNLRLFLPVAAVLGIAFLGIATVAAKALRAPPVMGVEALVGTRGTAKTAFGRKDDSFVGMAFVDGARFDAVAESEVASGDALEVVEVLTRPVRLRVKRVDNERA